MQGFEAKKRLLRAFPFPFLHTASILHITPFHAFTTQTQIEPGCSGWKLSTITTTLRSLQQCDDKISYLNQMHEKKGNGSVHDFCMTSFTLKNDWSGCGALKFIHNMVQMEDACVSSLGVPSSVTAISETENHKRVDNFEPAYLDRVID